jgi:hypothetical protein
MLAGTVALQGLQAIARRDAEISRLALRSSIKR